MNLNLTTSMLQTSASLPVNRHLRITRSIILAIALVVAGNLYAQPFLHPGIDMNQKDLDYMKKQVLAGQEPWKGAFERLKEKTKIDTKIIPVTHVIQGGYGVPDIGGFALTNNANTVYDCALIWYITGEEKYAQKAIEIIDKWDVRLWSFDDNNAKLLGGLSCYPLCSGAEILRYHYAGWTPKQTMQFSRMLMETFYPLLRFYYPEANGNWDGVISRALLSMAVFTDNRGLFNGVIDHFLHAPYNGSLFKYIYPSGQCQETSRDQGHVQMGLSEFAGAARIAYTQGVDLFSLGNNRLALGFEYTMNILFGGKPQSYGSISTRAIESRRDDYEYIYRHYTAKGVRMPMTGQMCEKVRNNSRRGVLIAFREEFQKQKTVRPSLDLYPGIIAYPAGATNRAGKIPANSIEVLPGGNLQEALDKAAGTGQWVVAKTGIHTLKQTLNIPSGTQLVGEGPETVLMFESTKFYAISSNDTTMHDVRISNLVIEGAATHEVTSDPNTGRFNRTGRFANTLTGIAFLGLTHGSMKNIVLENITVINFSRNGIFITGAENLEINNCNISDNGAAIVPGQRLQHNMLLRHDSGVRIHDSRFDTSLAGCGIALDNCSGTTVERCEIARNAWFGLLLSTSDHITISGSLVEGNSNSGIMSEFLYKGCSNVLIKNNFIQYNNGYGIEAYAAEKLNLSGNKYDLNGQSLRQENIEQKPQVILN
jgi:parallel beta-helix repeat protein